MQYTTGMGLGGGTLLSGWRGALFKEWTFATQITAGSGLPLTPIYLAAVRGTGSHRQHPAGLHGRAASMRLPRALPEPGGVRRAAAGPVGKRRAQFHHRARAVHVSNASLARTFRLSDRSISTCASMRPTR